MKSGESGYLDLGTGTIHLDSGGAPIGLHVKGTVIDSAFNPDGDVQGEGALGEAGSPGWMELRDGSFHGAQTSRPPFPPYIEGYLEADGTFRPKSREVKY
ncbi:MAG: hypothetical protein V3T05_13185 [Myxococcota bacterium]